MFFSINYQELIRPMIKILENILEKICKKFIEAVNYLIFQKTDKFENSIVLETKNAYFGNLPRASSVVPTTFTCYIFK